MSKLSGKRAQRNAAPPCSLVRRTLADSPMTPARKRKLAQLAARPDSEIDFSGTRAKRSAARAMFLLSWRCAPHPLRFSEIPPLQESFWKNAVHNPFYRPV